MTVTVLGSGSPIPYDKRAQSGFLIEKDQELLLIDCGSGTLYRLGELGVNLLHLNVVLLTHHHLDHVSDLLSILKARWLLGKTETAVYGPKGTIKFTTSLLTLFPYLGNALNINVQDLRNGDILELANFHIETKEVQHLIPALAYKLDNKVVISGDTEPFKEMSDFAAGCALFHECSLPNDYEAKGHSTPSQLGRLLADSDVKLLILTHFYPAILSISVNKITEQITRAGFKGAIKIANDLDQFII